MGIGTVRFSSPRRIEYIFRRAFEPATC